jgi:hypothetical protein
MVAAVLMPALTVVVAAAAPASATAVGPNQQFTADVNGHTISPAPINMACFGPVYPGETGHPMAGNYVELLPPSTTAANVGDTGSLGSAVNVSIIYDEGDLVVVVPLGTITAYNTPLAISTSDVFPCDGSGTAAFDPTPTSATARSVDLTVNFLGQP